MANSDDIYKELLIVKKDVESVKHQTQWILRSHAQGVAGHWHEIFGLLAGKKRNYSKMRVFLEVNGKRTVSEVALAAKVHAQDASVWLKDFETEKIVELLPVSKSSRVYQKTPADFALGISEKLQEEITKKNGQNGHKK